MNTVKVLVPDYYSEFHCIGSECPNHCCKNWGEIAIDKETYKKCKNHTNSEFTKQVQKAFKPITRPDGGIDSHRAAVIVLNERGECPFLTEDRLCGIQQKMGVGYLSITCRQYPRSNVRSVASVLEASLSLSCIEVARLALSPNKKQAFTKVDFDKKYVETFKSGASYGGNLNNYVTEIRKNCIEMMQDESLPVLQRIFGIAHFLQGMENALNKVEDNGQKIDFGLSIKQISSVIQEKAVSIPDYMFYLKQVLLNKFGSEKLGEISDFEIHKYIIEESQEQWKDFIKDKSLMLENYFVNFIFQKVFPFIHKELSMSKHAYLLWERYEMLRFFLGTFSIESGKISENDLLRVVSRLDRYFSHEKEQSTIDRVLKTYAG